MFYQAMLVGVGGFCGAISRFLVAKYTSGLLGFIPMGTLIVNVSGSFLLSFILYNAWDGHPISAEMRWFLAVGFIGAYTTMSTFAFETYKFAEFKDYANFGLNIALNLGLCLAAVFLGHVAATLAQR